MRYKEIIGTPHKTERDPLSAIHKLQTVLKESIPYINAMAILGLNCTEDLESILWQANLYAKDCAEGITRETSERFKQAQEGTANMMNALITGITIGKDETNE